MINSKSYGLTKKEGAIDYFWSIKKNKLTEEMGYSAPKKEIHAFKYEHEKLCADIFVLLKLSGKLQSWGKKTINQDIIPDRWFILGNSLHYLEAETGSHKESALKGKVIAYKKYFRETKERFNVLFVMSKDEDLAMIESVLKNEPTSYQAVSFSQLRQSIMESIMLSPPEEQTKE